LNAYNIAGSGGAHTGSAYYPISEALNGTITSVGAGITAGRIADYLINPSSTWTNDFFGDEINIVVPAGASAAPEYIWGNNISVRNFSTSGYSNSVAASSISAVNSSSAASAGNYYGLQLSAGNSNLATGTMGTAFPLYLGSNNGTSATMGTQYDIYAYHSNAGTITNRYGFAYLPTNTGTITNAYGLYINGLGTGGTYTNTPYDIYAADAGAYNYFAGSVGLGAASSPDVSALLDMSSTNKGLLVPRVALTGAADAATIATPATSLLVYNLGTGGLSPAGYYYNSGTTGSPAWVQLLNAGSASSSWLTAGNAGTNSSKFIGTTDNVSLRFRTNNSLKMIIDSLGKVGIGTATPAVQLQLNSPITPLQLPTLVTTGTSFNSTSSNTAAGYYAAYSFINSKQVTANSTAVDYNAYFENGIPATQTNSFTRLTGVTSNAMNYGSGDVINISGLNGNAQHYGAGTVTNLTGGVGSAFVGGSGTVTKATGLSGGTANYSNGTVTTGYGVNSYIQNYPGAGTITTAAGYNTDIVGNTGTIGTYYGIKLDETSPSPGTITNNYGVYQSAAAATNYFAGNVGIGTSPGATLDITGSGGSVNMYVRGAALTTANPIGIHVDNSLPVSASNSYNGVVVHPTVLNNIGVVNGFNFEDPTNSAGTMTTVSGFYASDLNNGTNRFGFRGILSAGSGKYNLYMDGTAQNYFAGNTGIGLTAPASIFHSAGRISTGIPLGGLGGAAATNGSLLFYNSANTNTVTLSSGATSASYALTLPLAQGGASTVLQNDGSGNLSWAAAGGSGWATTGNALTGGSSTTPNEFVGSTNVYDWVVKTANAERMRVASGGGVIVPSGSWLWWGTSSPSGISATSSAFTFNIGNSLPVGLSTTSGGAGFGPNQKGTSAQPGYDFNLAAGQPSGTSADQNGGTLTLAGGTSQGTGTSSIIFQTSTAGSTGTTANTPTTKMTILGSGNVSIGATLPNSILSIGDNLGGPIFSAGEKMVIPLLNID